MPSESSKSQKSTGSTGNEVPITEIVSDTVEEFFREDGTKVIKRTINKKTILPKGSKVDSDLDTERDTDGFDLFEKRVMEEHNKYREKHGVPPLKLNKELCEFAQDWANHLCTTKTLSHRPKNKHGENVYWKSGGFKLPADECVRSWYSEVKNYKWFGEEPPRSALSTTGHFSQIVWKETEFIGVGRSSGTNGTYVVANYKPMGNFMTHYKENILPLVEDQVATNEHPPNETAHEQGQEA